MEQMANVLRTAGDETRLRILKLLFQTPLNVSELTQILGLAQSGISRHLSHLKKIPLIREKKEGMWNYYYPVAGKDLGPELKVVMDFLGSQLKSAEDVHRDQVRLNEVLSRRTNTTPGLNERLLEPGQSWQSWSRILGFMLPGIDVADLGCGGGILTAEMARFARNVTAVDHNATALASARQHIMRMGIDNVTLLEESLESLSLENSIVDAVFFSQSLHHLSNPLMGLKEAFRILRNNGRIFIMELAPHKEAWVKEKLGHKHLGFEPKTLDKMMREAGFQTLNLETTPPEKNGSFRVILAYGEKQMA